MDTGSRVSDPGQAALMRNLDQALEAGRVDAGQFRDALRMGTASLAERFLRGDPIDDLVLGRTSLVDEVLLRAWQAHAPELAEQAALVAVGGYGRGELHPCSDVDVMILKADDQTPAHLSALERFVTFLWDIGLEIGHSVRTIEDCSQIAADDITVTTTLMEARRLAGRQDLVARMQKAISTDLIWASDIFFRAKLDEQEQRHQRYQRTTHNLEPNVKSGPGGMRDLQMLGWVTQRHFGVRSLAELIPRGFLTQHEYHMLDDGRRFLWRVRFALHTISGRREDRLLFDHQVALAQQLGYEEQPENVAVETFMQNFFRTVNDLKRLSDMLIQFLREDILLDSTVAPENLNEQFHNYHGYLGLNDDDLFCKQPPRILEAFQLMQQDKDLKGFRGQTIRSLQASLDTIDRKFLAEPDNHRAFINILCSPRGVTHELRRMNEYGVLGRYIPAFGRIIGRMQFDMFHSYTVDAHTLFVVSNLRRFALTRYDHEFPYCSEIMQALPKPELAYIAALFHDIAKGEGGNHSELGARDAQQFCRQQGLSEYDANLVEWLVRHHLLLSLTAQKKDISDPEIIHDFATHVGDQIRLDYLYVLTVADVRGTNPMLWNSWKSALFEKLYRLTQRALQRGLEHPIDRQALIREIQESASSELRSTGVRKQRIQAIWDTLPDEYFLRHSNDEIAWHTELLATRDKRRPSPLIGVRHHESKGGTSVIVFARRGRDAFARATAVLDELGLNIFDALITPTTDGYSLDTYHVLEYSGAAVLEPGRADEIERRLMRIMSRRGTEGLTVSRRPPRQARIFSVPPQVEFVNTSGGDSTVMELVAGDRPGLLSDLGNTLVAEHVDLFSARIMTVGERAEDVFTLSKPPGRPLYEDECALLRAALIGGFSQSRRDGKTTPEQ